MLPTYKRQSYEGKDTDHLVVSDEESTIGSSSTHDEKDIRIPHREDLKGVKGHVEEHFDRPELVRDCILGFADGITVPFALAAGLSSLGDTRVVIFGGLAGSKNTIYMYIAVILYLCRAGFWCHFNGTWWVSIRKIGC